FAIKYFYSRLRKLTRERSQALAEMQGHLHERVQGTAVVRSFANEDYEQGQFDKRNRNFLEKALKHTDWNAKTFAITNTITDLAPLLVIAFAAYQVIIGNFTMGTMVAFVGYMERVYSPLRRLIISSTTLTQSVASIDCMFEIYNEHYDIKDLPGVPALENIKGEIEFDDVSFQYDAEDAYALRHVNLAVAPGETIALVGMSGGGKSTLVSLIPRF